MAIATTGSRPCGCPEELELDEELEELDEELLDEEELLLDDALVSGFFDPPQPISPRVTMSANDTTLRDGFCNFILLPHTFYWPKPVAKVLSYYFVEQVIGPRMVKAQNIRIGIRSIEGKLDSLECSGLFKEKCR